MKYNHLEARCMFIDGPVAIYVSEAPYNEILEAYHRLGRLVKIAAEQLEPSGSGEVSAFINREGNGLHDYLGLLGDRNASEFP